MRLFRNKPAHAGSCSQLVAVTAFALLINLCAAAASRAELPIFNFMAVPGNTEVSLSWKGAPTSGGYNIKRATSSIGPLTLVATNLPTTSLVVTNLKNGTAYFFAVSSVSGDFESADTARLRVMPSAAVLDLLPAGAKIEKLASGFVTTFGGVEGPVWEPASGSVLFTDNSGNKIVRWTPGSGITTLRLTPRPNGQALDLQGRLITCEQTSRTIVRTESDGTVTPLVTLYKGKTFNEPNDVVVKSDGTVWFTDPAYINKATQPGNFVYRFDPSDGNATVTPVSPRMGHPNGLCFSPDEAKLLVADSDGQIRVFDVLPDNSLTTNNRVFLSQGADGIRATPDGRFFLCNGSVKIFGMDGKSLGELRVPENPANLCFGGTNREMLFITAQSSLYGITRMPDLIVTAINRFPTNPTEGQSVTFSLVVKNQGTAPTSKGMTTHVSFSINGKTNALWTDGFTESIPPDASVLLTLTGGEGLSTWVATRGTNSIKAIVDSLDVHRESNETNNVLTLNLVVGGPAMDSDGDGLNDSSETTAGTDPTDPASALKILTAEPLAGDRLALTWASVPGKIYRVSRQSDMVNLESAQFSNPITATTTTTSWTNSLPFARPLLFLRIQALP
jgi:gluconolactonase